MDPAAPSQGCSVHSSSAAGAGLAAGLAGRSSLCLERLCSHWEQCAHVPAQTQDKTQHFCSWNEYWGNVCSCIKSFHLMPQPCGGAFTCLTPKLTESFPEVLPGWGRSWAKVWPSIARLIHCDPHLSGNRICHIRSLTLDFSFGVDCIFTLQGKTALEYERDLIWIRY